MSTYLELCQETLSMAGLSGTGPASVVSQTGMAGKIVSWVAQAWDEIQGSRSDWKFMRGSASAALTAGDNEYGIVTDLSVTDYEKLFYETFRIYATVGETIANRTEVTYVTWQEWLDSYEQQSASTGRPNIFTVSPDDKLLFSPTPDVNYTGRFDYLKIPTVLSANGDVPNIPAHLHQAIVYLALRYYAAHDDATMTYQDADKQYRTALGRIVATQVMPTVMSVEPLA